MIRLTLIRPMQQDDLADEADAVEENERPVAGAADAANIPTEE